MKWSYSAHNAMRRCQRLFVFGQMMASHRARDPQRREAYLLKQLKHRYLLEEAPSKEENLS